MPLRSTAGDSSHLSELPAASVSVRPVRKISRQRRLDGKRRARVVENPEYREMLSRLLRALERRVSAGDPEDLSLLASLSSEVNAMLTRAVAQQRRVHGLSWSRLAEVLGVTKQAAQQRFARAAGDERGGSTMT